TETGATVARRGFYMFSIIYHAGAAVLFLVMSLAGGPRHLLNINEYVSYKNITLPTIRLTCIYRWSPYH
ncbi:hypothetical protein ACVGWK_21565, partial [Enterobacter sichuanensis]